MRVMRFHIGCVCDSENLMSLPVGQSVELPLVTILPNCPFCYGPRVLIRVRR